MPAHGYRTFAAFLEIAGTPPAVECRLLRTVDPEVDEPAPAGDGLDPAVSTAIGCGRTEVEHDAVTAEVLQFEQGDRSAALFCASLDL